MDRPEWDKRERIQFFWVLMMTVLMALPGPLAQAANPPALPKTAPQKSPGPGAAARPRFGKIVFIGKQDACDCTRTRVQAGWSALQAALEDRPAIPVVQLDIDRDKDQLEPFRRQRPVAVIPAVYFLDEKGRVKELVEGELSAKELEDVLEGGKVSKGSKDAQGQGLQGSKGPVKDARVTDRTGDRRPRDHRSVKKPSPGTRRTPPRRTSRTARRGAAAAG